MHSCCWQGGTSWHQGPKPSPSGPPSSCGRAPCEVLLQPCLPSVRLSPPGPHWKEDALCLRLALAWQQHTALAPGAGAGDKTWGRELVCPGKAEAHTWALPWWPRRGDTGTDRSVGWELQWARLGQNRAPRTPSPRPGQGSPRAGSRSPALCQGGQATHRPWATPSAGTSTTCLGPGPTPPPSPTGPRAPCPGSPGPSAPARLAQGPHLPSPCHIRAPRAPAPGSPPRARQPLPAQRALSR